MLLSLMLKGGVVLKRGIMLDLLVVGTHGLVADADGGGDVVVLGQFDLDALFLGGTQAGRNGTRAGRRAN
jgi:hypothetical protein